MSVQSTREALSAPLEEEVAQMTPSVYEMRFVRLDIRDDSLVRSVWAYLGKRADNLNKPGAFCSCRDFTIRTIVNKKSKYCKHQVGVYTAIKFGKFTALSANIEEALTIVQELLDKGFSISLRRKLIK
ncbi:MAG: SWIM zinc finger family protein [Desulfurococcaceae archaeon]